MEVYKLFKSIGRKESFAFNDDVYPLRYIHPFQYQGVKEFLSRTPLPFVKAVFIYGSTLDVWCTPNSDLDLYIVIDEEYLNDSFFNFDSPERTKIREWCRASGLIVNAEQKLETEFWARLNELNTVENEIQRKGLCIYERPGDIIRQS